MLNEKIELLSEYYFRPYKKNLAYQEKKEYMLKELKRIATQLKVEGRGESEVYEEIVRRFKAKEIKFNLEDLSIDESSTLRYIKKIFTNENLEELDFVNVEYNLCDFKGSTIQKRNIKYTNFKRCYFKNFNIDQSELYQLVFKKSDLTDSSFDNCIVADSLFYDSHLPKVSFANSRLLNTTFERCYLKKTSFRNAKLINVRFNLCTLSKLDFSGSIMDKTTYRFLKNEYADLSEVEII